MGNKKGKPIILGHRGASKYAPENTMAAFEMALEMGADGFELDTMLSADGVPVVIHDERLERTTNGSGRVASKTLKRLRQLDAGSWLGERYSGERIPLLEDVLANFKGRALINIELKNYSHPFDGLTQKVLDLVKRNDMMEQILISSFFPGNITFLQRTEPKIQAALLTTGGVFGRVLASRRFTFLSRQVIHPHKSICTRPYVAEQHQNNRKVNAWTVNEAEEIRELTLNGVDGIITDDPALARKIAGG